MKMLPLNQQSSIELQWLGLNDRVRRMEMWLKSFKNEQGGGGGEKCQMAVQTAPYHAGSLMAVHKPTLNPWPGLDHPGALKLSR